MQFPMAVLLAAAKKLLQVFWQGKANEEAFLAQLVAFGFQARRDGLLSLDNDLPSVQDSFMPKS